MYAVVVTGGKQFRVQEGDVIFVEKLNAEVDSTVELTEVLAVSNGETLKVGTPVVEGAKVVAKVAAQGKAKKITVFKYKPKKDYRKKTGHRQPYTKLVIEKIEAYIQETQEAQRQQEMKAQNNDVTKVNEKTSNDSEQGLKANVANATSSVIMADYMKYYHMLM